MDNILRCIFINGPSSAGKTSIAHSMVNSANGSYTHFSMDEFLRYYNNRMRSKAGEDERPEKAIELMAGLAREMISLGDCLIVDAVAMPKAMAIWLETLKPVRPYLVYVGAPDHVLEDRERARGDRNKGMAAEQVLPTREAANYGLYIDTSRMGSEEAAAQILSHFNRYLSRQFRPINAPAPDYKP